jgi:hypothetical protein
MGCFKSKTNPINRNIAIDISEENNVEDFEYSEFFLSMLNHQYKFSINGVMMWFNEGHIYQLNKAYQDLDNEKLKLIKMNY